VAEGIEQILGIDRLDQDTIHAGLQQGIFGFEKHIPCHADDGQLVIAVVRAMVAADAPGRLQATDTGHGHVHQHHLNGMNGHEREGLLPTGSSEDRGAMGFKDLPQTMAQTGVILSQKNAQSRQAASPWIGWGHATHLGRPINDGTEP